MDYIITAAVVYGFFWLVDFFLASKGHNGTISDHFDGNVFYSYGHQPITEKKQSDRGKMWKWILSRKKNAWRWRDLPATTKPNERVMGEELVVTFINHATLLIQTEGKNILTDPVWSKRVSPFSFMGPKRYQHPGVLFADLPPIDVVLITETATSRGTLVTVSS